MSAEPMAGKLPPIWENLRQVGYLIERVRFLEVRVEKLTNDLRASRMRAEDRDNRIKRLARRVRVLESQLGGVCQPITPGVCWSLEVMCGTPPSGGLTVPKELTPAVEAQAKGPSFIDEATKLRIALAAGYEPAATGLKDGLVAYWMPASDADESDLHLYAAKLLTNETSQDDGADVPIMIQPANAKET